MPLLTHCWAATKAIGFAAVATSALLGQDHLWRSCSLCSPCSLDCALLWRRPFRGLSASSLSASSLNIKILKLFFPSLGLAFPCHGLIFPTSSLLPESPLICPMPRMDIQCRLSYPVDAAAGWIQILVHLPSFIPLPAGHTPLDLDTLFLR